MALIVRRPTDAWGEEIDLPGELLRLDSDGQWAIRCWSWHDPGVYCRGHRADCGGLRWEPDTPEVRLEHPEGEICWQAAHECHGAHSVHG